MMKTQARHILMRWLLKEQGTGYGVDFKTSARVAVAKLNKEGYLECFSIYQNFSTQHSDKTHDFIFVKPSEKLLAIKDQIIIKQPDKLKLAAFKH